MRAMSDFLDRLVARAIDGGTALTPRLPSLFEPQQRAPTMPAAGEGEAPAHHRDTASAAPGMPIAAPSPREPARAAESVERSAARVVPVDRTAASVPARAAASSPHAPMPPPIMPTPVHSAVVDRSSIPARPERQAASPSPVQPRRVRVAPARQETARTPASNGALLPASTPVFAAPRAAPAPSERTVGARSAAARAEGKATATGEPVVHVSIGRLEVRAAPSAAAPSRRRQEPRPSSLDDYLRQRGGKASP
jgi:hypothetical protein